MPELPEVEIIKLQLEKHLVGKRISNIDILNPKLKYVLNNEMFAPLLGQALTRLQRIGKYLFFFTDVQVIISHLGMTGNWLVFPPGQNITLNKHNHLLITLDDGTRLIFNDVRKFGFVVVSSVENYLNHRVLRHTSKMDGLSSEFTAKYLKNRLVATQTNIKSALMNNKFVMGVGNIYVCEALFLSGISPEEKACSLTDKQLDKVIKNLKMLFKKSVSLGGSSLKNYRDTTGTQGGFQKTFLVYGRAGQSCSVCGAVIKSIKQQGRTTFFCPSCQK